MNCRRLCVALSIALVLHVVPAAAQLDRASLTGTVTDATGAVIVGAKVGVTHEGSGLEREGEVGTAGAYMIPQLPIGIYTVKIEAAGFRSVQFDKVQLLVGQTRTLDAKLEIATAATAIEVRDMAAALDRSSAEIGTVVQSAQVSQLPINGRNWASLMVLAAGAVNTGEGFQDDVRFVGRANDDNNWTFDGVDNTAIKDPTYGTGARLVVSMDSIAEFKVSSSLYSADSGGGMGGQVHLVSKSGSNAVSRRAVRVLPQQRARRAHHLRRSQAGALPPEPVRRQHRRPDQTRTSCSSSATTKVCGSGRVRSTPTACPARRCAAG